MRLDKFLKLSRVIKRRTVANSACDAQKVLVNGKLAKASYNVKLDDIIEISLGNYSTKIKVLSLKEPIGKEGACDMYETIS